MIAQERFADANVLIGEVGWIYFRRALVFARFDQVLAIERAVERGFALPAAALGANLTLYGWTAPPRPPDRADIAGHHVQLSMVRAHVFFKVEIEHDEKENPEKIAEEIARHLRKLYVTRKVEVSSVVPKPE